MFLSSERINSDLELALEYPDKWSQHFVVRFVDLVFDDLLRHRQFVSIPIEFEFRGFVVNNQLRAMCQYYHWLFFPTLVENKAKLNEIILNVSSASFTTNIAPEIRRCEGQGPDQR